MTKEKMIHIKAESGVYSVDDIFPESQAERVLTEIRDNFKKIQGLSKDEDEYLTVDISVVE